MFSFIQLCILPQLDKPHIAALDPVHPWLGPLQDSPPFARPVERLPVAHAVMLLRVIHEVL
jgi:hypothetical protein